MPNKSTSNSGLTLDILKVESWTQMGRTANIIIKYSIHVFASISKNMRILLMGRRYCERCWVFVLMYSRWVISFVECRRLYNAVLAKYHWGQWKRKSCKVESVVNVKLNNSISSPSQYSFMPAWMSLDLCPIKITWNQWACCLKWS